MAVPYCTNTEIKNHLVNTGLDVSATHDTILSTLADRASELIDTYTKRSLGSYKVSAATTRYFNGSGCEEQLVDEFCEAPTTVSVAETGDVDNAAGTGGTYTTWSTNDYWLEPMDNLAQGRPYEMLVIDRLYGSKFTWYKYRRAVKITAKWGFSTTPPLVIVEATIIQAARWFKRGEQTFMDGSANPTMEEIRFLTEIDPDVKMIVEHMRKTVI